MMRLTIRLVAAALVLVLAGVQAPGGGGGALTAERVEPERFHYWPDDHEPIEPASVDEYRVQPALAGLGLDSAPDHGGAGTVVAILDTGADTGHPEFAGRLHPASYDFVDGDADPLDLGDGLDNDADGRVDEGVGHGTHVAGIVRLLAPDSTLLVLRVLDSDGNGDAPVVVAAISRAIDAGADVLNLSFGTRDRADQELLRDALARARKAGVTVVAAAGNEGSWDKEYPAASPGVIGVAATTSDGMQLAPFSNRGDWVSLAAPGEDVVSTVPGGYGRWSGTSMATPFVAGLWVALEGENPGIKDGDILRAVVAGAREVPGRAIRHGAVDYRGAFEALRRGRHR